MARIQNEPGFTPAQMHEIIVVRMTGTGIAFTPFDTMQLARVMKVSDHGVVQETVDVGTGKRRRRGEWTSLHTLPPVIGNTAQNRFPDKGWLPWEDGRALLRKIRDEIGAYSS